MFNKNYRIIGIVAAVLLISAGVAMADRQTGMVKIGFLDLSEEGSPSVYQPNFNMYQGFQISLEKYNYRFDNGTCVNANFKNITLKNRNLSLGVTRARYYGINLNYNQYRRIYNSSSSANTERETFGGNAWLQPHRMIRLYGGIGSVGKKGSATNLYNDGPTILTNKVDYSQKYFNSGLRFTHSFYNVQADYRSTSFDDGIDMANDRNSTRTRINAVIRLPFYQKVILNGGFQHYTSKVKRRFDTLSANTAWGGMKYNYGSGYSLKYNFIWDRARRTGDLAATDNITQGLFISKVWPRRAGITLGYRHKGNDMVPDELSSNGYYLSTWAKITAQLTTRANYGSENKAVNEGQTLTGDRDYSRYRVSLKYDLPREYGNVRLIRENRKIENNEIGSESSYGKWSLTGYLNNSRFGELDYQYSYLKGEYDNSGGLFEFSDNILTGNYLSPRCHEFQLGAGGRYVRSRQDVDIESSRIYFKTLYSVTHAHKLEITYTIDNFDNLADMSRPYAEYYTANIIEVSYSYKF
ncbi:MAG: hypothetical protein V3V99_01740 [candidate division Zixibacteria bacterium]